jgi:hypothetical protein
MLLRSPPTPQMLVLAPESNSVESRFGSHFGSAVLVLSERQPVECWSVISQFH